MGNSNWALARSFSIYVQTRDETEYVHTTPLLALYTFTRIETIAVH